MTAITPERVLVTLRERPGIDNGLRAAELVQIICQTLSTRNDERYLRQIVSRLRLHGFPVLATPETGYYWPANAAEIKANCRWLHHRAMTHLKMIGKLKSLGIPIIEGQLVLAIPEALPRIPEMEKALGAEAEEQAEAILAQVPKELYQAVQEYGSRTGRNDEQILLMALSLFLSATQPVEFVRDLSEAV